LLYVRQIHIVLWCFFIILDVDVDLRLEATLTHYYRHTLENKGTGQNMYVEFRRMCAHRQ